MSKKDDQLFVQSIPWTVIDGGFSLIYAIGMVVLLGYFLSPEDFGLAGIALAVTQLLEMTYASGLQEGIVRAKSAHTHLSDTGHTLAVGFAVIGAILCSALAWPISTLYGHVEIIPLIMASSIGLISNAFFSIPTAKLSRKMRIKILTSRNIVAKIFAATTFIICALSDFGAWSIILSNLASSFGSLALISMHTNRFPRFRLNKEEAKILLSYGMVSSAGTFFWAASIRVFSLLFGFFHGVSALGYFQFAQRLVDELAALLQVTVVRVGLPYFSALNRNKKGVSSTFLFGVRLLNTIAVPVFIGTMLVSPIIVPMIFGEKWNDAIPMIWVLAISWAIAFNKTLIPVVLRAKGLPKYPLRFSLIMAGIAIASVFVTATLNPVYTVIGWGVAQITSLPYQFWVIKKEVGPTITTQIKQNLPAFFSASIMAGLVFFFQYCATDLEDIWILTLSIIIGVVSYSGLILLTDKPLIPEILDILHKNKKN